MLGDSVVGVKHCIDPEGRQGHRRPRGRCSRIGAASLIAFVFAFYTAVDNAAYNKGRYDYETQVLQEAGLLGSPAHAVGRLRLDRVRRPARRDRAR